MSRAMTIGERQKCSFAELGLFLLLGLFTAEKKKSFEHICLFSFIALAPIGDFILQGTPMRSLGISPAIFPLCALALVSGALLLSAGTRVSVLVWPCLAYVLLTALYGLVIFGVSSHGENLLWKGTTSFISLAAFLFATQLDYSNSGITRTAIYAAFFLLIIGFLLGNSNPLRLPALMENGVLHFTPLPDERPRGLAREPSQFSVTAIAFGLLTVYVTRSRIRKILLFAATIGLLIASGSKGGILTLFLCVIIISLLKWHSKWYHVASLLLVLLPAGLILIWLIPNLFPEESFAFSGTVPTRFSMILCALTTVVHHPLGVGVTGFLPAVAKYLPDAMSDVQAVFPFPLNFGEVSGYLESADMVGTKTFFFDQLMRFGIPFVVAFFMTMAGLLKRLAVKRQTILLIAVVAATLAIMTYQPGTGNFAISILFGVALKEVR